MNEYDWTLKIDQYTPMIYKIMQKLSIYYNVEDYVQVGRIAIYEGISKYDTQFNVTESQFIYTKIYQRLIDEIRKDSKKRYSIINTSEIELKFEEQDTSLVIFNDCAKAVLNRNEYYWFDMTIAGFSMSEIALTRGVSLSTVKYWRKNAREKLKIAFES